MTQRRAHTHGRKTTIAAKLSQPCMTEGEF